MNRLFSTICLLFLSYFSFGQNCLSGEVPFTTQAQIDNFSIDYPGCITILGDLVITADEIFSLEGLSDIIAVGGELRIENTSQLSNLEGLNNITSINHGFSITENSGLESIDGFSNLEHIGLSITIAENSILSSIGGFDLLDTLAILEINDNPALTVIDGFNGINVFDRDIRIRNNDLLATLNGFQNLTFIDDNLIIEGNNAITSFDAFPNLITVGEDITILNNNLPADLDDFNSLTTVFGDITLHGNDGLQYISGFNNLFNISDDFNITSNPSLLAISGFNELALIAGNFYIFNNSVLHALNGFNSLTQINENLTIFMNPSLTNINGLSSLMFTPEILIYQNPLLSDCSTPILCTIAFGGSTTELGLNGNASGCNSEMEILNNCLNYGYSGQVYYDFNQNQIRDSFEAIIPGQQVLVAPQNDVLFTNQNGIYFSLCEEGQTYTFTWVEDPDWQLTTDPAPYTTIFDADNPNNQNNDFGLYPTFTSHDFSINTTSGQTRCNTNVDFHVDVCSQSTFLETSGTVIINYDELTDYVNAEPAPFSVDTFAHTITWMYDTLYPFQCLNYVITFGMPDVETIGENIGINTQVYRDSLGTSLLAQEATYEAEIVCSYDPNDKQVTPPGEQDEHYTLKEETLDYTIRFQNTGNIYAIDVTLRDTLDTDLDWSTFRVVQASHLVQTTLSEDGAISFYFKDIYLPDSLSNPIGSQGFVRYTIDPIAGLPDYTVIDNTAYIYFDQNPAIITNTTVNTLVDEMPVGVENLTDAAAFKLYPNPTTGVLHLVITESLNNDQLNWQLLDVTGKTLQQHDALQKTEFDLSSYPSGLYMILLREGNSGQLRGARRVLVAR